MYEEKPSLNDIITQILVTALLILSCVVIYLTDKPIEEPEETVLYVSAYPGSTEQIIQKANDDAYINYIISKESEEPILTYEEEEDVDDEIGADLIGFLIEVSADDIDLLARVVMSEASVLNFEAKQMIAQTVINRVRSSKFPNTVSEVVYKKNQYSTQNNGKPNRDCYAAVYQALRYEDYPTNMYYFRTGHYHTWATDYRCVDGCYFSTDGEEK